MDEERLVHTTQLLHDLLIENKGDREKTIEEGISVDLFTQSEALEIIEDTCLSEEEKKLAVDYFLDKKTKEEISSIYRYDRRTVRRKIRQISLKLKKTVLKMLRQNHIKSLI